MNNEEILKKIMSETIDLMFKDAKNFLTFSKFIYDKNLISNSFDGWCSRKPHHITFHYTDCSKSYGCLKGDYDSGRKTCMFYEDVYSNYSVELL